MPRSKDGQRDTTLAQRAELELRPPRLYRVYLLNDDYTTMDFVVYVLESLFGHSRAMATRIMLQVHTQGAGLAGTFPRSIAETKANEVVALAQRHEMPLQARTEPEDEAG